MLQVDELVDLARRIAIETPAVLPAFLWSVCRSSGATKAFRMLRPEAAHLAVLQSSPVGARLIASSRAGAQWLRKRAETTAALDDLIPPIAPDDQDH